MRKTILAVILLLSLLAGSASATEINSRYTTISYQDVTHLRRFNDELTTGSLFSLFRSRKKEVTVSDEVAGKIDLIVEKVEMILEMFPKVLKFKVVILATEEEVRKTYFELYNKEVNYIAFYSPKQATIFISAKDAKLHVFAHEIAHVVVDHYFEVSPSVKIHEVLAQYAEKQIYN